MLANKLMRTLTEVRNERPDEEAVLDAGSFLITKTDVVNEKPDDETELAPSPTVSGSVRPVLFRHAVPLGEAEPLGFYDPARSITLDETGVPIVAKPLGELGTYTMVRNEDDK